MAVHADGPGAVTVAEHPAVHFAAESAHFRSLVLARKAVGLVVKGFNLFGNGEVFVGDCLVGDPGVDHRHGKGLVFDMRVI